MESNLILIFHVNFSPDFEKTNFEIQINFNANTRLVLLFKIHFRPLFYDTEKKAIP